MHTATTPDVTPTRQGDVLAVLPVVVLALVTLWWPDNGDQTLFRITGARMNHGTVYYRDFWDIKQPGIYWFHQFGDLLLPGGLGARLLEVALAVCSAVLVTRITAHWPLRRSVRRAAPTMVLGPYLIWSFMSGVGQIEGLMNVLLLTVLASTWPSADPATTHRTEGGQVRPGPAWFLAGLSVGAVLLLKTLYTPIPLVLLVGAAWQSARLDRRRTAIGVVLAALGAALPVIVACGYLLHHGVLELALRTTFELPAQVAANPDTHDPSSRRELEQAIKNMFPVIGPLAAVGLLTARRRGRLAEGLTLAATSATALILTLPQLWTTYRWLMLAAPVGLLSVAGLESVLAWLQTRDDEGAARGRVRVPGPVLRTAGGLAVVALTLPMLSQPIELLRRAGQVSWGLDQSARIGRGLDGPFLHRVTSQVQDRVTPGEQIYVLGDPGVMALLHADQGAEIAGWSMPVMPPSVWDELVRELDRSRPALVFVDNRDWTRSKAAAGKPLFAWIDQNYRLLITTADGTWYQTDRPGLPLPEPGGNQLLHR